MSHTKYNEIGKVRLIEALLRRSVINRLGLLVQVNYNGMVPL